MKRLTVYYPGTLSLSKDKKIKRTVEGFGGIWHGSGLCLSEKRRDHSFTIPDECEEIICAALKKLQFSYKMEEE